MKPIKSIDDPRYIKAMSHPLRVRILAMLGERPSSPSELAELLGATLGTTAYHVRTLHKLGLIDLVRETRVRGAVEHHYEAKSRPHVSDEAWGRATPIAKQAAIGSTLQVFDEYARTSAGAGGFDRAEAQLVRTSLRLDDEGFQEVSRVVAAMLAELADVNAAAAERIAKDPHAPGVVDAAVVVMAFEAARLTDEPPRPPGRRRSTPAAELAQHA